ncbi:hypothetical protein HHK36_015115 [Tetracentron sinense]|uniref:RING-type E3 ubiquitin transferase n=1 Tax=Tetracentron sinense TaxID=13715 RepID=A0A834Z468_TETSI|nr:hypothetical protein HHK36_015115 [Tetracentron sinense]
METLYSISNDFYASGTGLISSEPSSIHGDEIHQRQAGDLDVFEDGSFFKTLSRSNFRVIEGNGEIGISNQIDLELRLGLGLSLEDECQCGEGGASVSESDESSSEDYEDGLRVISTEFDWDEEENEFLGINLISANSDRLNLAPDDLGLPLRLENPGLESQRVTNEGFDAIDDVVGRMFDAIDELQAGETWELAMQDLRMEPIWGDLEMEFEWQHHLESLLAVPLGQFMDLETPLRGSPPPVSRSVVENLSTVFLTQEDVKNNNNLCAVCKDEISMEEKATQLPCSHHYHGDCILPWLSIRNTCPVCRYELPTDDADYVRRTQRAGRGLE